MKKLSVILCIILTISLVACGKSDDIVDSNIGDNQEITEVDKNTEADSNKENEEDLSWVKDFDTEYTGEKTPSDIPGYSYTEEGLLIKDEVAMDDPEIGYEDSSTDNFQGELVIDYSKVTEETLTYTNRVLISGSIYDGTIDLDTVDKDWESVYNKIISNIDDYIGKVIKVRGVSYNFGDGGELSIAKGKPMVDYISGAYPTNGETVEIIGTIVKNNENSKFYIDTKEVSRVY